MARMAKSRMAMVSINPIKYQSRMKSKTLQDREAIYKLVFDNCFDGLAYCQMIFDSQGQPIDFVYKLVNKSLSSSEYFLVENRQKTGFDVGLPGSGLLIWHIDQQTVFRKISSNCFVAMAVSAKRIEWKFYTPIVRQI